MWLGVGFLVVFFVVVVFIIIFILFFIAAVNFQATCKFMGFSCSKLRSSETFTARHNVKQEP